MKKIIAGFSVVLSLSVSIAQNEGDALRYARYYFTGSARYASMGGAFGALGADISNAASNPAGIGLFRKSQFTLTPGVSYNSTRSDFLGFSDSDNRTVFNLANMGLVFSSDVSKRRRKTPSQGFQFVNFAIAYTKNSDLNNQTLIQGINRESSLLDVFESNANAGIIDPYYESLAISSQLLVDAPGGGYTSFQAPWPQVEKRQRKEIESRGSMGDVSFALGANLANSLYLGFSLNISVLDYRQTSFHYEEDSGDSIAEFTHFTLKEYFRTRGSGVSGKFGLIYRPADFLRLGIAFHTPTSFSLTDRFANDLTAQYDNGATTQALSPEGVFKYRYSNPMRLQISSGFVLSKFALLGLEYELVPYKGMRFRESTASTNLFQGVNDRIRDVYRTGHSIKMGTEFRLDPFSLRAGFTYAGSPYRRDINHSPVWGVSAGAGYRDISSGFFIDFAYSLFVIKEAYWLYDSNLIPAAMNRTGKSNFLLTGGINF